MPTPPQWTDRIWHEFSAGNLTRSARDVLLQLKRYGLVTGQRYPSHATLAERAKCKVSTVQRALKQAQHLGLVDWAERRVKVGWRWLRTSNRYWLMMPKTPIAEGMRLRRPLAKATNGHLDRGPQSKLISAARPRQENAPSMLVINAARTALANRIEAFEVRQRLAWRPSAPGTLLG